ncbi:MAG: phosphoribosylformylglycinamidine cyclo-ligase [Phycisphaerales bacterium]|nr:phosphoribosylformylglycinamidine cyclo-ligase [Phycisphaerales bacterium]
MAKAKQGLTYAAAGVDIAAGDVMVRSIQSMMRRTHSTRVIDLPGGFAGMFRLDYNEELFRRNYRDPVLVACTDGVGTKVKLAAEMGIYDTVGIDLVAMSVNDLIVQGAEPLFFLDYLAVHALDPKQGEQIVKGVAEGCKLARCALIGGETAEMSDVYAQGDFDMAGFAVGVLELHRAIDTERVAAGDIVIGIASNGLHSNGFSLVRRVVEHAGLDLHETHPELDPDRTLGEVLLTPTRIYARPIVRILRRYKVKRIITGMAHITGGGLPGNVNRALHDSVDAVIDRSRWEVPAVFPFIQEHGEIDADEMDRVFNMGIGYVLIVRPSFADSIVRQLRRLREEATVIGVIVKGSGKVVLK